MRKKLTLIGILCLLCCLLSGCGKSEKADPSTLRNTEALTAMTFDNGSTVLRFSLSDGGTWQWADDSTFPLDGTALQSAIEALQTMESTPISEDQLDAYGLSSPEKYFALTYGQETQTYYVGAKVDELTYATPGDDLTTACLVPEAVLQLMCSSIYDLAILPQLPQLAPDQIIHVDIVNEKNTLTLTPSNGKWLSQGADVTERTTQLQQALSHLSVARCVDYAPTDGVDDVCGLTKKAAVVTVQYTTSTASSGKLTLAVGNSYGDGYFARLGEDTTIYQLPQEIGESIWDLVKNGI